MDPSLKEKASEEKGDDTAGIEAGMLAFNDKKIVHVAIHV